MKKFLFCTLIFCSAFLLKSTTAAAQLTYDDGYRDGFAFAVNACTNAANQHPEWGLVLTTWQWFVKGTIIQGNSLAYNDYQLAMMAVNYVSASYYGQITANMNINDYYNGYYYGYLGGTAAVVIPD